MGVIRTVLAVDGENQFKNSMKTVNSQLKAMQASVKALSSEYTANGGKLKTLRQQNEQLEEVAKQQTEKIKLLSGAVDRSKEAYDKANDALKDAVWLHGQNSAEAEEARKAVASAAVTYNNYRTQLSQTEAALNDTRTAIRNNNEELNKGTSKSDQFKKLADAISKVGKAASTVAKVEMKAFTASVKAVSSEFELAIKGLTAYTAGITAAATAVGKFSVDSGASFEQSISKLQAISGASAEDMERLEKAAKETGATTTKTAAESADALTYMALAGWKTEDMLVGLNPIVKASEAGAMDLATASDLITDSLAAYGKEAADLPQYLDIITAAQSNSNTSMQQMLEAYVEVGGTFKNLNVPMEESAAILGTLANRGIKGSEAGNKLSSTLVNLIGANKNADSVMKELGVSAWDAQGNFIGMSETIRLLGNELNKYSQEDMMKFEAKIAGKLQIDTLQALIAGTSDEFGDLIQKLEESEGALEQTADVMLDNFNGAVTITKSALEALGISIYGTFGEALRENVENIGKWAADLSSAIDNDKSIVGAIDKIGHEALNATKKNIQNISKSLPEITAVFNKVILESVDVALGTGKLAIGQLLPTLIDGFFSLANGLVDRLPELGSTAGYALKKLFDELIPQMQEFAANLVSELPIMFDNLFSYFDSEGAGKAFLAGLDILMSLINGIAENLPLLLEEGGQMLITMVQGIVERLPDILQTGVDILLELINGIISVLPDLIDASIDILLTVVDTIMENLDEIIAVALEIILALIEGITRNLDKVAEKIPEIILAVVEAIIQNLDLLLQAAVEIILALGNGLVTSVDLLIDIFPKLIEDIGDLLLGFNWADLGKKILEGIAEGFTNVGTVVVDNVKQAGEEIMNAFTDFFDINSPSRKARDVIGKNVGLGVLEGTTETLEDSEVELDTAANTYTNDLISATKKAYINADFNVATPSLNGSNLSTTINFGNVTIANNMDIDEIAYQIAEKQRSFLVGGGGY